MKEEYGNRATHHRRKQHKGECSQQADSQNDWTLKYTVHFALLPLSHGMNTAKVSNVKNA
jgi:hypothetical protein